MNTNILNCSVCGEEVPAEATKCPHCDCDLKASENEAGSINVQHPNQSQTQTPGTVGGGNNTPAEQIMLWNPSAAANWSLLFSPIFGSILHMKNWKTLGNESEVRKSKIWLIISAVLIFLISLNIIPALGGVTLLVVWYIFQARKQIKEVKTRGEYTRKSWKQPILIASGALAVALILNSCTGNVTVSDLQGSWRVDTKELFDILISDDENPSKEEIEFLREKIKNEFGDSRVIFSGDTMILKDYLGFNGKTQPIPFKVTKNGPDFIIIECAYGHDEYMFTFTGWGSIEMTNGTSTFPLTKD